MNSKDLSLDLFSDISIEETNLFNRRDLWNPEDATDEKYREYLAPQSLSYFSRLRPMFSFEVKNLDKLSAFNHVLFRDGTLFLLRFFSQFPVPGKLRSKILIHKDCSFIVPEAWREHIICYETVQAHKVSKKSFHQLVWPLTLGELDFLEEDYEGAFEIIGKQGNIKNVYVIPQYNMPRGEDYLDYDRSKIFHQMKALERGLKGLDVIFIDISKRGGIDFNECLYLPFNPGKIYFSDSSFDHEFLGSGACSLTHTESDEYISLSPYHGMRLQSYESAVSEKRNQEKKRILFDQLGFPLSSSFQNEPVVKRDTEDFYEIFYYSKSLLKLCRDLGRGIF